MFLGRISGADGFESRLATEMLRYRPCRFVRHSSTSPPPVPPEERGERQLIAPEEFTFDPIEGDRLAKALLLIVNGDSEQTVPRCSKDQSAGSTITLSAGTRPQHSSKRSALITCSSSEYCRRNPSNLQTFAMRPFSGRISAVTRANFSARANSSNRRSISVPRP